MYILALVVSVFGKKFVELGVGEDSCLRKTIHSSLHFSQDKSVVHECEKIVLVKHFLGKRGDWNTNMFVFYYWHPKVKIFISTVA